ncbi:MAG: glycosyltransferase family 39 protein [Planctomycetaceae bacterium]|nr:glycosyltransferase family 39 protein [Planctomycetaceae bacterium]
MFRSADNVLVVCAVGIAATLMGPGIRGGPLELDEHAAYWLCAADSGLSIWERTVRYAAAPPLTSWVQATSLAILGKSELALRLPSMLAYVVAVGVLGWGCRVSIGGLAAALGACALALHPDVVDEVRVGRTYGLVVLWITALLVLTLHWRTRIPSLGQGALWGLMGAAAVWTHILTIPVVGLSALLLGFCDLRRDRFLSRATMLGWLLAGLLCIPLVPMIERIWEWRYALNYQLGSVPMWDALGPMIWLGMPLAGLLGAIGAFWQSRAPRFESPMIAAAPAAAVLPAWGVCIVMSFVPLALMVLAGQGDLSSLAHPRYRIPLAPAVACLVGLMCGRWRRPSLAAGCLGMILACCWLTAGRSPWQLVRLGSPQAPIWKEMGETLTRVVREENLEHAPVFVQSGLIESALIPVLPEDLAFHGYVSSRLGRFYAPTQNPRYALPLFWGREHVEMLAFFERTVRQAAASDRSDLFVAVAIDTDVNRNSFQTFSRLLEQIGYQGTVVAGQEPWAVLYHYRR